MFDSNKLVTGKASMALYLSCVSIFLLWEPQLILRMAAKILPLMIRLSWSWTSIKWKKEDVIFVSEYSIAINKNWKVHSFVGWFDSIFEDPKVPNLKVTLSFSAFETVRHSLGLLSYESQRKIVEGIIWYGYQEMGYAQDILATCTQNTKNWEYSKVKSANTFKIHKNDTVESFKRL